MEELSTGKPDEHIPFKSNFAELEQCFRELKSELYTRRNEVSNLKTELELANQENHELRASLDKLKKNSEENQITMNLFIKKSKDFEPKYYEKRDALIKLELQYKIATSEIAVLKEDLQTAIMQKSQLARKVDVLEEKQKRDSLYSNEISQKLIQLKSTIATVTEDLEKLKKEQSRAAELSQKVDLAQETLRKCEGLSKLNQKLKQENTILQEQSISCKAKLERLNEFLNQNGITKESDLQGRVILSQCTKISAYYKLAIKTKNDLLTVLNKNLCEEKATNLKLIKQNEQLVGKLACLEKVTTDLQTKLSTYNPNKEDTVLPVESPDLAVVKVEAEDTIIEIFDISE